MCLIAEILFADMSAALGLVEVILKVALGLGFVIFVHELGHFLVAKACGVKCEKFMVGFDIGGYKLSRRWGETEYGIGILPLGGYVKMLGQDDDPAHIAEQMQKSQVAAGNPDAVEVVGPNGEKYRVDRRSYLAKSVPQRMAIISAGVTMNVIFAVVFAAIAYGMGVPYMPSIVSETVPGSPAWQAAIEPGDEIVQLGDRVNPTFTQLRGGVMLGDLENGIPCIIRRAEDGQDEEIRLTPTLGRGLAKIGIISPRTLTLADEQPVMRDSAAAHAKQLDSPVDEHSAAAAGFQSGDQIVAVNNVRVSDYRGFASELARQPDMPLQVTVRRAIASKKPADAAPVLEADEDSEAENRQELTFEVPPRPMQHLGLVMKMGPIAAVQEGSPAQAAGLAAGDLVVAVDGRPLDAPTSADDWTPESLPEKMRQAASAGRAVTLTVSRKRAAQPADAAVDEDRASHPADRRNREQLEISVSPQVPRTFHTALPLGAPLGVPALGIAYRIENQVAAVLPDSPAAKAEIEPGDLLLAAKLHLPKDSETPRAAEPIPLGRENRNWPMVFDALQLLPANTVVELTVASGDEEQEVQLSPAAVELYVAERGFNFMPIERIRRAESFGEQLRYGWEETYEALTMVYRFLQKLGSQVPITALGGPITIAKHAGYSAYAGMSTFLVFLTLLSANLAVINFLPIPLLDGGHMVFLAYEGVRGRPASEKFVVALHTVGFVFIVGLMLFVIGLDVGLIPRNL